MALELQNSVLMILQQDLLAGVVGDADYSGYSVVG